MQAIWRLTLILYTSLLIILAYLKSNIFPFNFALDWQIISPNPNFAFYSKTFGSFGAYYLNKLAKLNKLLQFQHAAPTFTLPTPWRLRSLAPSPCKFTIHKISANKFSDQTTWTENRERIHIPRGCLRGYPRNRGRVMEILIGGEFLSYPILFVNSF